MEISAYWDNVEEFTAVEAAYLILGMEPEEKQVETFRSVNHVLKRMHIGFLDGCHHYRIWLQNEHDWEVVAGPSIILSSVQMLEHYFQCIDAPSVPTHALYREYFLYWLDGALEEFSSQRFDRWQMDYWLKENDLASAFEFDPATKEASPEERRLKVRELLAKHHGNKSAAAREMGISRQRVDQLIGNGNDRRKALQRTAQDPFGLAHGPKEDPE